MMPSVPLRSLTAAILLVFALEASSAEAQLTVNHLLAEPSGTGLMVSNPKTDDHGNTSIRHFCRTERAARTPKYDEVLNKHYYVRDRDLGQTFTTGAVGFRLQSVVLRTGFDNLAVRPDADNAEMYLQIFRVKGTPAINNRGTTTNPPGALWRTYDPTNPLTDDVIDGITLENLLVVRGGIFPASIRTAEAKHPDGTPNSSGYTGAGHFFELAITADLQIELAAHTTYAFMVGFVEPGADRGITLANEFFGTFPGGHGIRREGSVLTPAIYDPSAVPPSSYVDAFFIDDLNDPDDLAAAVDASSFDRDFETRVAHVDFTTQGMPDVCTFRDLNFYILGESLENAAVPDPPGPTSDTTPAFPSVRETS